jgi:hypothetical protein
MNNNNIILQINERQSFHFPPTLKSHSFAVGINNYGMQIRPTSDPLAISQRLTIANIQKKNMVNGLYNIPVQMRILKIVEQDRGIKST